MFRSGRMRPIEQFGDIVAHPTLGGLHHRYEAEPLVIGVESRNVSIGVLPKP